MFANTNKTMIKLAMVLSISLCSSANAYELYQSGYAYHGDDIINVLNANRNRLPNNFVRINSDGFPFNDPTMAHNLVVQQEFINSFNAMNVGESAIAPINVGGHWAALVVKRTAAGGEAIYNDNSGASINPVLKALLNNLGVNDNQIKDLQTHQPQDSNGCGAFAVENLINIANAPDGETIEQLRARVLTIVNSLAIRINHARDLGYILPTVEECTPKAKLAAPEVASQAGQLINNLTATNGLTHNRMRHLNSVGVASGDEDSKHGVWVKGFIGSATDKDKSSKVKSNLHGFILGADTKINEDITIGAAYNRSSSKSKQKGASASVNNIDSNIYSIYGNSIINDNLSLSANVSLGKAALKTNNAGVVRKSKGDLLGSSVVVDYKLYSNESFAIEPRIGASYNYFSMKGHESDIIKIAAIKQHRITLDTGVVLTSFHDIKSFTVMPEISADYSYAVLNKGNKVQINSRLLNETVLTQKISNNKGEFKLGAGLTVASDRVEIGGNYEHVIQGKSRSHIGYAKLRLNF